MSPLIFHHLWWNHVQCLSIFILKKSLHSVLLIKCRTTSMLPIQQLHWGVIATGSGYFDKIQTMTPLFSYQICWICFQEDNTLLLLCFQSLLHVMFLILWSVLRSSNPLHDWVLKTSIYEHVNAPLVPHSIICFRILKNLKSFTKIVQPSRLASVYGQQLCSLVWKLLWNFFFWSILTFWVRSLRTKLGNTPFL